MILAQFVALTVVSCPNCISSVGGSGQSYMWGTVAMLGAPAAMAAVIFFVFRQAGRAAA